MAIIRGQGSHRIILRFHFLNAAVSSLDVQSTTHPMPVISGVWNTEDAVSYKKLLDFLCENVGIAELKILTVSSDEQMQWEKLCPKNEKLSFYVLENADGNS